MKINTATQKSSEGRCMDNNADHARISRPVMGNPSAADTALCLLFPSPSSQGEVGSCQVAGASEILQKI